MCRDCVCSESMRQLQAMHDRSGLEICCEVAPESRVSSKKVTETPL